MGVLRRLPRGLLARIGLRGHLAVVHHVLVRGLPIVIAAVAVVLGGAAAFLFRSDVVIAGSPAQVGLGCPIVVYLDTDEEMHQAADALRNDPRISDAAMETKQQAYVRFTVIFRDQPELVKLARPEALPASVTVRPKETADRDELVRQLRSQYPKAEVVTAGGLMCEARPHVAPSTGNR